MLDRGEGEEARGCHVFRIPGGNGHLIGRNSGQSGAVEVKGGVSGHQGGSHGGGNAGQKANLREAAGGQHGVWPVAFETFGGWDDDSAHICRRIASILACNKGKNEGQQIMYLIQRVAMAIQKGNATMFISRLPEVESELIDGDM